MAISEKHSGQADLYMKYKGKKPPTESEQILFTAAHSYLKGVLNGRTTAQAWKAERDKLTAERRTLSQQYLSTRQSKPSELALPVSCGRNSGNSNHKTQDMDR